VIPVAVSRQTIVDMLRRAGLEEAATAALNTLPDPVDEQQADRFCKEHGLPSMGSLTDRMGGSPRTACRARVDLESPTALTVPVRDRVA
jgi:hypothetical protein